MLPRSIGGRSTRFSLQPQHLSNRCSRTQPFLPPSRIYHRSNAFTAGTRTQHLLSTHKAARWRPFRPATTRSIGTAPLPKPQSRLLRFCYRTAAYCGTVVLVAGGIVLAFFIYDATTYRNNPSDQEVSVSELALHPERGGPKNLPIASVLVDDDDIEGRDMHKQKHKPKLVILGTGWGSVALLKQLNPDDYHITVVSPSNYFLFTPMLPSATVGTLELRSLVEPVRRIITRVKGHFLKAEAEDVEFSHKLVEVSALGPNGEKQHFYLPYDKLIIGVGEQTLRGLPKVIC